MPSEAAPLIAACLGAGVLSYTLKSYLTHEEECGDLDCRIVSQLSSRGRAALQPVVSYIGDCCCRRRRRSCRRRRCSRC